MFNETWLKYPYIKYFIGYSIYTHSGEKILSYSFPLTFSDNIISGSSEPGLRIFFFPLFFCGTGASHCRGLSRCGAQAPGAQAQWPRLTGPSRSAACGIFPDRGTNPCPLQQQADSQPLRHQGSPILVIFKCTVQQH